MADTELTPAALGGLPTSSSAISAPDRNLTSLSPLLATAFPQATRLAFPRNALSAGGIAPLIRACGRDRITFVDFSGNSELRTIAGLFDNCSNSLVTLRIGQCGLSSLDNLDSMEKLRAIVAPAQVEPGLASIGSLPECLNVLVLSHNPLLGRECFGGTVGVNGVSGAAFEPLARLRNLDKLSLSECGLRVLPPLGHMRHLRDLKLNHNLLMTLPDALELNTQLKFVDVGRNQLRTVKDVAVLARLPMLQQVTLHGNPLEKQYNDSESYREQMLTLLPSIWLLDNVETPCGAANRAHKQELTRKRQNRHLTKVIVTQKWQAKAERQKRLEEKEQEQEQDVDGRQRAISSGTKTGSRTERDATGSRRQQARERGMQESSASKTVEVSPPKPVGSLPEQRNSGPSKKRKAQTDRPASVAPREVDLSSNDAAAAEHPRRAKAKRSRTDGDAAASESSSAPSSALADAPGAAAFDAALQRSRAAVATPIQRKPNIPKPHASDKQQTRTRKIDADEASHFSKPRLAGEHKNRKRSGVVAVQESKGDSKAQERRKARALDVLMQDDDAGVGEGGSSAW